MNINLQELQQTFQYRKNASSFISVCLHLATFAHTYYSSILLVLQNGFQCLIEIEKQGHARVNGQT